MKLGIVGWRGMVGSVLIDRMTEEKDYEGFDIELFSTSQSGKPSPKIFGQSFTLKDAHNIDDLKNNDVIVSCQGSDYTAKVHGELRKSGWNGYWVDASSGLRMQDSSTLLLDPINEDLVRNQLQSGCKDFIGSNCTVSLFLMAVGGLFKQDLVEWASSMTYQAASGAGAQNMMELINQWKCLSNTADELGDDSSPLEFANQLNDKLNCDSYPKDLFGAPLAGSLIPWIDKAMDDGETKEEWKAIQETNKILGNTGSEIVPIDGTCVRIGSLRCHSQGITLKLKKDVPLNEVEDIIRSTSEWTEVIDNTPEATRAKLTPAYASGTLKIPVGRIRKMKQGPTFVNAFTIGDQLLWGAAEPLRRFLKILK